MSSSLTTSAEQTIISVEAGLGGTLRFLRRDFDLEALPEFDFERLDRDSA
jgi:hypothetical protein